MKTPFRSLLMLLVFLMGAPALAETEPAAPAELLEQAEQLRAEHKWEEALDVLREAVARDQEDRAAAAMAQAMIGQYLVAMALPARAQEELESVLVAFADQMEAVLVACLHLIDAHTFQGRPVEAEAAARDLVAVSGTVPEYLAWGHVKLARLLRDQGRHQEAMASLAVLGSLPDTPALAGPRVEGGVVRAELLMDLGMHESAIPVLEEAIQLGEGYPHEMVGWAKVRLLEVLTDKAYWPRAVEAADRFVADEVNGGLSRQQLVLVLLWKGRALERAERFEEAIEPLQMCAAVADGQFPDLVYQAEFLMGQAYGRYAQSILQEGGDWGSWAELALKHFQNALHVAREADLGTDAINWALRSVGFEMRGMGMRERAIAWLRQGIDDPASLDGTYQLLADAISEFVTEEEAEAWHEFLLDPAGSPDPTAAFVAEEFGAAASPAQSHVVDLPFQRRLWKARLLEKQGRWGAALARYRELLDLAETDRRRAEVLTQIAIATRHARGRYAARGPAETAARAWIAQVHAARSPGDAHGAIDMVAASYERCGFITRMLMALEELRESISPQEHPSVACFLRFRLMQEYHAYGHLEKAVEVAEEALAYFLHTPFPATHAWLCSDLLINLAYLHAELGDFASAQTAIDQVEHHWPEQYTEKAATHRNHLYQMASFPEEN